MRTIPIKKIILAGFTLIFFIFCFNSCKKTSGDFENKTPVDAKAAAIKAIIAEYGNVTNPVIYPVNKMADEIQYYKNGKFETLSNRSGTNPNPPIYQCTHSCATATVPSDMLVIISLQSFLRLNLCEGSSNSNLVVTWNVSAPFVPQVTDPNNSSNKSYGSITIVRNTSISSTWASTNLVKIRDLGTDSRCSLNNLYEVSYTVDSIPEADFANMATISAYMRLYNNCSVMGYQTKSQVTLPGSVIGLRAPCERVDKVWINPGVGPNPATAAGSYIVCSSPAFGLTPIDNHQLEYRKVTALNGSLEWDDQSTITSPIHEGIDVSTNMQSPTINPYTGVSNLSQMTSSTGTWLVRYRNVYSTTCQVLPPLTAWNAPWFIEVWPL